MSYKYCQLKQNNWEMEHQETEYNERNPNTNAIHENTLKINLG